jgi:hypothetical protein
MQHIDLEHDTYASLPLASIGLRKVAKAYVDGV